MGGECSHHCAIPASHQFPMFCLFCYQYEDTTLFLTHPAMNSGPTVQCWTSATFVFQTTTLLLCYFALLCSQTLPYFRPKYTIFRDLFPDLLFKIHPSPYGTGRGGGAYGDGPYLEQMWLTPGVETMFLLLTCRMPPRWTFS